MTTGRESLLSFVILFFLGACLSAQTVTEFPLRPGSNPVEIVAGPDGNLWFTEYTYDASTAAIGRITTAGTLREFGLPAGGYPVGIAAGPDGNLWFTKSPDKIGRITTSGLVTEFPLQIGRAHV